MATFQTAEDVKLHDCVGGACSSVGISWLSRLLFIEQRWSFFYPVLPFVCHTELPISVLIPLFLSSWHPWLTLIHLPFSAPCSWMGESIARALAAASTGYGKELNWPPLTLPVLLWLMLLPQQEKSKGLEGGAMETAPLSHACKKALTSSPWWVAPADYHRGTVGSSPFHTGAAIWPILQ